MAYDYVIVGGGLAGASAIEGIRSRDPHGSILLLSRENHPPYHRPPLSKDLWFGTQTLDQLPVHDPEFYRGHQVELALRREVVELDPERRVVWDDHDAEYGYGKLLLATGGTPRRLNVEGADHESIHYYRHLEDYQYLRDRMDAIRHALVLGGGFIGTEIAAAIRNAGKEVTLLYPEQWPLFKVLPRDLGLFVAEHLRRHGIEAVSEQLVNRFEGQAGEVIAHVEGGNYVTTQLVLAGIGLAPASDLAEAAGLEVGNGIEVDEFARTSDPFIYAAGDVAEFPSIPLGRRMRVEHWDHALHHGKLAGASMAGGRQPYDHIPLFFSSLFDVGWEAVGEVESRLETHAVWRQELREGVIYYLADNVVRGVLLWNIENAVDWARDLIREGRAGSREERETWKPVERKH